MTNTSDGKMTSDSTRPTFGGCIFCYAGKWIAYGGRKFYNVFSK